jgi:hypothetical protein
MVGTTLLRKVFEPLAKRQIGAYRRTVTHPDDIWLEVGKRKMKVRAESLTGAAREEALGRIAAAAPQYGDYPKKTDRAIPIIRLTAVSGS